MGKRRVTSTENSPIEKTPKPARPPALGRDSTTLRPSWRTRVALLVPVCAVAFFFVARQAASEFYGLRVRQELAALRAEVGGASIAQLAPKPPEGTSGNPAHRLQVRDFPCVFPPPLSSRIPDAGFDSDALTPEQKTSKAYGEFQHWHGLSLAPWGRPTNTMRYVSPRVQALEWNDEWNPWLRKHLDQNYAALHNMRREVALGTGYFANDWHMGRPETDAEYSMLRHVADLFREDAVLKAHNGDAKGACEDVIAILRLRRFIDRDPVSMAMQNGMQLDSKAFSALHAVMEFATPDRESANAILDELESRDKTDSIPRALACETLDCLPQYDATPDGATLVADASRSGTPHISFYAQPLVSLLWLRNYDEYYFLREMRFARAACGKPLAAITVANRRTSGQARGLSLHILADMMDVQQFGAGAAIFWGNGIAEVALARTALALSLYRTENGQYPESLAALVPGYLPKVPTDPFDGAPIKYVLNDSGFVIYSIGPDGKDNGGQARYDIPWGSGK
jgi:hypothetical protein